MWRVRPPATTPLTCANFHLSMLNCRKHIDVEFFGWHSRILTQMAISILGGNIDLPKLLTEREAAQALRVKPPTVRAERIRGVLSFVKVGARIFYTPQQLAEYLQRKTVTAWASSETAQVRSEATGSARSPGETASTKISTAPGTTSAHARRAVSALARQTFRPHRSSSRSGSSRTSATTGKRLTKS